MRPESEDMAMSIKAVTIVRIYENQDKETTSGPYDKGLKVESHFNRHEFVILEMLNGDRVTVAGRDLQCAIENAMRRP